MRDKRPIDYAKEACSMMMERYAAQELPPKGHFHYHQGVFLSGMHRIFLLCGDREYQGYIKSWVDSCIREDGTIRDYDPLQLDDIQPGILLFHLADQDGGEKYRKTLDILAGDLLSFPRNASGGLWHKGMLEDCIACHFLVTRKKFSYHEQH